MKLAISRIPPLLCRLWFQGILDPRPTHTRTGRFIYDLLLEVISSHSHSLLHSLPRRPQGCIGYGPIYLLCFLWLLFGLPLLQEFKRENISIAENIENILAFHYNIMKKTIQLGFITASPSYTDVINVQAHVEIYDSGNKLFKESYIILQVLKFFTDVR